MPEASSSYQGGPYLQAALFCERVLTEKDNVHTLVRVIDRLHLQGFGPDASDQMPELQTSLTLALMVKSGEARGTTPIRITMTRPSGLTDQNAVWEGTVPLEGGTRGHSLIAQLGLKLAEPGPYWFNVYIGDGIATKIPLEVIYTFMRTAQQPPPLSPG